MKKFFLILTAVLSLGVAPAPIMKPLMWEQKNPKRNKWSEFTFQQIYRNFDSFNKVKDMDFFCPNYNNLNRDERVNVWGQLIAAMSWYESGHNPKARLPQPSLGIDPVTNQYTCAEGLLQLGYADTMWHSYCDFDWSQDIQFDITDGRKTTFDPYINLKCGIGILANQIDKYGKIVLTRGAYWSVLKDGHKNSRLEGIRKIVSNYEMCKLNE
jgi:hypothetical protein